MANKSISGVHTDVVTVGGDSNTWTMGASATIVSVTYGISVGAGANNNIFNIAGSINAAQGAVMCQAPRMTVNLSQAGHLEGVYGIFMQGTGRLVANVDGEIDGLQYGIGSGAASTRVALGAQGSISGPIGIYVPIGTTFVGDIQGDISNALYGIVSGADDVKIEIGSNAAISAQLGLNLYGTAADVRNNGQIDAIVGMTLGCDDARIVNGTQGEVTSIQYCIATGSDAGEVVRIVNHGVMISSDFGAVVYGDDGDERVVNDGRMVGILSFDDGNDQLDTRGGTVKGIIYGGAGDDTLITDRASHKLTESGGEGTADTVRSTVSYTLSDNVERLFLLGQKDIDATGTTLADILHGNAGDNDIKGLAGADTLYGHKGNDRLFGGADLDADLFYFATGDGKDRVMDYLDGVDQLHLEGWNALTSLTDLKNNHATNQGANLLIEAGGDSLLVLGIHKSDLDAGDVYF